MAKKVIRLTESDVERLVRKIIKEESINEIGGNDFEDKKGFDAGTSSILSPAIAKMKGKDYIVVVDKSGKIIGYGPSITPNMNRAQICTIAQRLIEDWEDEVANEYKMDEADQSDFQGIKPITFCTK